MQPQTREHISDKRQNRTIEVPVLPYVAKVMRRLYGHDTIHACHNTLRGKAMAAMFCDIPDELPFPERVLPTEKVVLELNYRVARLYTRWNMHNAVELGTYYEKVVQRMMLSHIVAQIRAGMKICAAVEDFCTLYDIEEDDYARSTALMMYHNYKKAYNL